MSTREKLAVCYMYTVKMGCAAIRQFTDITSNHLEWRLATRAFNGTVRPNPLLHGLLLRSEHSESTCTVLTCFSEEFQDFFDNETLLTTPFDNAPERPSLYSYSL